MLHLRLLLFEALIISGVHVLRVQTEGRAPPQRGPLRVLGRLRAGGGRGGHAAAAGQRPRPQPRHLHRRAV